ncbi:MAG: response regulator transcription factor [Lachnospiraceae bacterium]|nr:response regulator transcription factor [Lachnospiraceae bacterium]
MKYKIGICDDEQLQIDHLKAATEGWSKTFGHACDICTFSSAEEFLFAYEDDKFFDILLLDVEMGEISGIALAKKIRIENKRTEIIFITSHFEFFGEGYEVDALHYLIKPVEQEKLGTVLSKAVEKLAVQPPSVLISVEGETVKLYEEDILYVESMLHYLSIVTKDREYKLKEKISAFEVRLSDDFFRIHRSYLVSLKHIIRISRASVTLSNGAELPLARGKYDDVNYAFIARN